MENLLFARMPHRWRSQVGNIYQINTYHIVQANTPAFKKDLTRESIHKCKPDLKKEISREKKKSQEISISGSLRVS